MFYTDGSYKYKTTPDAPFNMSIGDWQYSAFAFTLDDGDSAKTRTPNKIRIYVSYKKEANTAYFDDIQLVKDAAPSYTYDKDGNLVTVAANAEQNAKMEYTNSNLTSRTDPKGNKYSYTYDSRHNMTQAKSQRGVLHNYTYNGNGNATQYVIQNASGTEKLQSSAEYTSNGAFVSRVLDQNGYAASYSYNDATGVLNNATDAGGNTVSYTYDPKNDWIQSVSQTLGDGSKVSNSYGYTGENLTNITHNGFSYGFTYDSFGNVVKTSVGSQTLSTNTYGPNNGDLQKVTYGNGATVNYTYDNYGNTTAVAQNGSANFKWSYNSTGYANQHVDLVSGLKYDYTYDTTGRLIRQNVRGNASNTNDNEKYRTEYQYDQNNNITKFTNQAGGRIHTEQFTFGKDNLPESYTLPNGVSKTYKFGPINRPYQTVINTKTPIQLETLYHLSKRNAEGQSDYRTTQIYQESLGANQYRYSYDKLGNITEIQQRENGTFVTKCTYEYDGLNQLTRENNVYTGKTKVYTYDNGGNILKETEYPYTTGTVGTPTATNNYGYGDTNWKDKLTSYNGQAITYDAIGNPLSYRGNTLTWQNGRQLATLNGNGTAASYKYDANGLRTEKTVNGVKTVYYYVGDELVYEKRGANTELYYFYDESGSLSGIRYILNGKASDYVVVTNWRGDVEALYDLNGNQVAQYIYDAWGSQISIQDGNGNEITNQSHIATVNPFRYRGYYLDTETGLYYLQARYYDAQTHRMINADKILAETSNTLGSNLFSYCMNNPINLKDDTGNWPKFVKKAVASVKKTATNVKNSVVKTVNKAKTSVKKAVNNVKKKIFNKGRGTYSTGINISGNYVVGYGSVGIGVSVDRKGKVAIQATVTGGASGGLNSALGVSLARYNSISNASGVDDLLKGSNGIGGSLAIATPIPISGIGGFDINGFGENNEYVSYATSLGISSKGPVSAEGHVTRSYTYNIFSFNLFEEDD